MAPVILGQVFHVGWIAQVSGDKWCLSTGRVDLIDDGCAARGVAADDDDIHAVTCESHRDLLAERPRKLEFLYPDPP